MGPLLQVQGTGTVNPVVLHHHHHVPVVVGPLGVQQEMLLVVVELITSLQCTVQYLYSRIQPVPWPLSCLYCTR